MILSLQLIIKYKHGFFHIPQEHWSLQENSEYFQFTSKYISILTVDGRKHKLDEMLGSMLSKGNLSAPPLDKLTAFKILNVEPKGDEIDPKVIL